MAVPSPISKSIARFSFITRSKRHIGKINTHSYPLQSLADGLEAGHTRQAQMKRIPSDLPNHQPKSHINETTVWAVRSVFSRMVGWGTSHDIS
ncbi:hypothetical protein NQ317_017174 [Molorchus minor]|uniref:Uncharacterized protein n=1 Tax=Molorchus minor TaxID=1323400 RepID=A0ABQ9IWW6_9CUCU|nr:hypothetical protein NQ317_017174 [Molorchus minor]